MFAPREALGWHKEVRLRKAGLFDDDYEEGIVGVLSLGVETMNQQTGNLIGSLTVGILLFAGGSILFDARSNPATAGAQYGIAALFFAMAGFRIWRLVIDHRRAKRRSKSKSDHKSI